MEAAFQWKGLGPQVNKFEQFSSDDHQMLIGGGGVGDRHPGPMPGGGEVGA